MQKQWYLISYDVHSEARLRRVARKLEGYGSRIQYSIFRCRLNPRELERLRWELLRLMELEDDLMCIRLCGNCASNIWQKGQRHDWTTEDKGYEIIG
jgi:CRISPR-associated protein Cas2